MYKFLEVKFHDNDFGWPVQNALKRLWEYVSENNAGHQGLKPDAHFSGRSNAQLFAKLYKVGALVTLIERLYCLEYLSLDVEFKTRGLYWAEKNVNWKERIIKNAGEINFKNDYLNLDLKLRKTETFKTKWQNGEHAYLNLETGEVGTF